VGLFERLDRLDDRVLAHLPGAGPRRQAANSAQVMTELACRTSSFLRDHPVLFGVLVTLDLFNIVTNVVSLVTVHAASQRALRVGQLVGGLGAVAMLLLLRQGRPRPAIDAATVGITASVLVSLVLSVVEGKPGLAGLAAFASLFLVGAAWGRRFVPQRCPDA
jgi:hypothetical protein